MSDRVGAEDPHGSVDECEHCGEDVHTDVGRCDRHFRAEFVSEMDNRAEHGVFCSSECLARWADAQ